MAAPISNQDQREWKLEAIEPNVAPGHLKAARVALYTISMTALVVSMINAYDNYPEVVMPPLVLGLPALRLLYRMNFYPSELYANAEGFLKNILVVSAFCLYWMSISRARQSPNFNLSVPVAAIAGYSLSWPVGKIETFSKQLSSNYQRMITEKVNHLLLHLPKWDRIILVDSYCRSFQLLDQFLQDYLGGGEAWYDPGLRNYLSRATDELEFLITEYRNLEQVSKSGRSLTTDRAINIDQKLTSIREQFKENFDGLFESVKYELTNLIAQFKMNNRQLKLDDIATGSSPLKSIEKVYIENFERKVVQCLEGRVSCKDLVNALWEKRHLFDLDVKSYLQNPRFIKQRIEHEEKTFRENAGGTLRDIESKMQFIKDIFSQTGKRIVGYSSLKKQTGSLRRNYDKMTTIFDTAQLLDRTSYYVQPRSEIIYVYWETPERDGYAYGDDGATKISPTWNEMERARVWGLLPRGNLYEVATEHEQLHDRFFDRLNSVLNGVDRQYRLAKRKEREMKEAAQLMREMDARAAERPRRPRARRRPIRDTAAASGSRSRRNNGSSSYGSSGSAGVGAPS